MGMSLDGFIAGPGNPLGDGGMRIHHWTFDVEAWRERQSLRGGKINRYYEVVEEATRATLETLRERLAGNEPSNLAAQLPTGVAS